jgi:hypothetical protein
VRDARKQISLALVSLAHYAVLSGLLQFLAARGSVVAGSRTVAGSRPDEVNDFFSIYLILPTVLGPGVHSASNRNEYQKQNNNVSGE